MSDASDPASSPAAAQLAARLAQLWQASRPTILERLAVLQASRSTLQQNPADTETRSRAREAAHKLSGILGTFGLPRGSQLAFELEQILKSGEPLTPVSIEALDSQIAELDAVIASKK